MIHVSRYVYGTVYGTGALLRMRARRADMQVRPTSSCRSMILRDNGPRATPRLKPLSPDI